MTQSLRPCALNATAETFLLTRKLKRLLQRRRVAAPVFMALSADDPVIDVAATRGYFENRFSHPGSRLVVYRRDPREGADPGRSANQLLQQLPARATDRGLRPSFAPCRAGQRALWRRGRLSKLRPEFR